MSIHSKLRAGIAALAAISTVLATGAAMAVWYSFIGAMLASALVAFSGCATVSQPKNECDREDYLCISDTEYNKLVDAWLRGHSKSKQ